MKIYVAASYPRKIEAIAIAERLKELGHQIVSGWMYEDEGYTSDERVAETEVEMCERMARAAIRDIAEVKDCELLVCLTGDTLTRGGRHGELGMALVLGLKVIIIGPRECVFHYHFDVQVYEDEGDFWYDIDPEYGT